MSIATGFDALIPRLETERLILRGPRTDDFDGFAAYMQSERSQYAGGPLDHALAWRSFCSMTGHWVHRGYGFFVIEEKASGQAIGTAGPWFPVGWPEREIGWAIWNADGEGQGFAHEAAVAARAYVYDTLGWDTVISLILAGNTRSEALAKRMGATPDGTYTHPQYGATSIWRHPSPADLADGGMEAYA